MIFTGKIYRQMAGEMKNGRQLPVTGSYLQPWIHLAEEKE